MLKSGRPSTANAEYSNAIGPRTGCFRCLTPPPWLRRRLRRHAPGRRWRAARRGTRACLDRRPHFVLRRLSQGCGETPARVLHPIDGGVLAVHRRDRGHFHPQVRRLIGNGTRAAIARHANPDVFFSAEGRRRTARTLPLLPPPQKNRSPPSDSSPDTPMPGGMSTLSRTSPVRGSIRLRSLSSPSHV